MSMMGIQYAYHKQQWFLTRGFEMNASRIDSLAADYADENGCVSADKVFEIFSECIEEDPATSHEL